MKNREVFIILAIVAIFLGLFAIVAINVPDILKWGSNLVMPIQEDREQEKVVQKSMKDQSVSPGIVRLTTIPESWNGCYSGVLDGRTESIVVLEGRMTMSRGTYIGDVPYMMTLPTYYQYLGYKTKIEANSLEFAKDKKKIQFEMDAENKQIVFSEDGVQKAQFTKISPASGGGRIPSAWDGIYTGEIFGRKITVSSQSGSMTGYFGKWGGKTILITFPAQAEFWNVPIAVTESKIELTIRQFNAFIQLVRQGKELEVFINQKSYGKLKRK